MVTKSGTNDFHGTAFEYFRNDVLDANNWFADNKGLKKPELRQNDFGGVLGGPIMKDKLFFFGSYEGLRVRQPKVANTYEPTLASIQSAPAVVQPLLNAFPKPNGKDLGNGTAEFSSGYSDPSSLNAGSIRIDYLATKKITIFGRYNDAPSNIAQRASGQLNYNTVLNTEYGFQTVTAGSSQAISPHMTNEFRFNYSRSRANGFYTLDNFGGAVPPSNAVLFPSFAPQGSNFAFLGDLNPYGLRYNFGKAANNLQQQINLTDTLSYTVGAHQLKFGVDYRRLESDVDVFPYQLQYVFLSLSNVIANKVPQAYVISRFPATLIFPNWSLFAQDTWNITRTLTITYGLRWDYNGSPSSPNGTLPFTVDQVNNFATMTLAPAGTPLWHAQKDDFAPRLGIAWNAASEPGRQGGRRHLLRLRIFGRREWCEWLPLWAAKLDTQYFISVERFCRGAAAFQDGTARSVVGCDGPESRAAQDLRMECRGATRVRKCRRANAHLYRRGRSPAHAP